MKEPSHQEISHQTIKLLIGVIAISLGSLANLIADKPLTSISASYFEGEWSQTFVIGFLFAIAAFLIAYNGYSKVEMILAKVAAGAAAGVAMFPCNCVEAIGNCRNDVRLMPEVHGVSAAVLVLAMVAMLLDWLAGGVVPRMVWYGETAALLAKLEERPWGEFISLHGLASKVGS